MLSGTLDYLPTPFVARDLDSFTKQIVGSLVVQEDDDDDDVAKPKPAADAASTDRTTATASLKQAIVACSGERAGQGMIFHNWTRNHNIPLYFTYIPEFYSALSFFG